MSLLEGFKEPVIFDVQVIADAALAKFEAINGELGKMELSGASGAKGINKIEVAGKLATGVLLGMGAGMAAFGAISVKEAMAADAAMARLTTSMKDAGITSQADLQAAKDLTQQNVKLGFSVEDTATAFSTLITATGSQKDATQLLSLAQDVARYKHISLNDAAITLARASVGNSKAFKEFGITLDTTLPKQQAINKAMDELSKKTSGQNAAYLDTFAGKLTKMGTEAKAAEEKFGNILIPIISKGIDFITKFGTQIMIFVGTLGAIALAIKIVEGATKLWTAVTVIQEAVMTKLYASAMIGAGEVTVFTAAEAAAATTTGLLTGAVEFLTVAIAANPIGAFVVGLTLAAVAASKLFGWLNKSADQAAAMGVEKIGNPTYGGRGGPSGGYTNSFDKVQLKKNLDAQALAKSQTKYNPHGQATSMTTQDSFDLSGMMQSDAEKAAAAAEKKRLAAQKKANTASVNLQKKHVSDLAKEDAAAASLYSQMDKVIADSIQKGGDLVLAQNDRDVAAQDNFNQTKLDAQKTLSDDLANEAQKNVDAIATINQNADDKEAAITQTYNDAMFNEAQRNTDALASINQTYNDKVASDTQAAADKRLSIIQQSIDLMTSAWDSAVQKDMGTVFASANAESLKSALKVQLDDILKLQKDAGALASQGYNQAFIQEIIKLGPSAGDSLAQSVLQATPETQASIKQMYGQIQTVSESGMDSLAQSMNNGTTFATDKLADQYKQVGVDLAKNLAVANDTLNDALAKQQLSFDENNAASLKKKNEAMTAAEDARTDALAKQADAYKKADAAIQAAYDKTMTTAQDALTKALTDSQTQFDKDIAALHDTTMAHLQTLEDKLVAVAAKIKTLAGAGASVAVLANSPAAGITPTTTTPSGYSGVDTSTIAGINKASSKPVIENLNVNVQQPQDAPQAIIDAIKYGALAGAGVRRGD